MAEKIIKGLTCPSCGGSLEVREGIAILKCSFCSTTHRVVGMRGLPKYYVPMEFHRPQAVGKVKRWFGSWNKAGDLKKKAILEEGFLVYLPFWRIAADVVGWVFGKKKHTRSRGNRRETYWTDEEREVKQHYDVNFPACDISEFGVQQVDLRGDRILPMDLETVQRDGMTFEVTLSADDARDRAQNIFLQRAEGTVSLDRITYKELFVIRERRSLIFYPLWVFRYHYRNRTYQVAVDGEDGSIAYGKAPGNNVYRAAIFTGAALVSNLIVTTAIPLILGVRQSRGTLVLMLLLVVCAFALIIWGYKKFRYGGEVEEGTGKAEEKGLTGEIREKVGYFRALRDFTG
jgi:hypothetical protein